MNVREIKILTNLFNIARDIEPPTDAFRVAAVIYDRNRFVCYGFNSDRTDPLQKRFSTNPLATCIHAEMSAIKNAINMHIHVDDFKTMTMYVARAKFTDKYRSETVPGLAKPCNTCARALQYYKFKKCIYTQNYDEITNMDGISIAAEEYLIKG